jgi:cytochrome c553
MIKNILSTLLLLTLMTSCYWDNEEALYGDIASNCNVTEASYSQDVTAILDWNCYSCHSKQSAPSLGSNIILDSYDLLIQTVNNKKLIGSINHKGGYAAMPKSASKLSPCDIQTIQSWIDNGAQNN